MTDIRVHKECGFILDFRPHMKDENDNWRRKDLL